MIVYCAITPHPPLIIPGVGKDNARFVARTSQSLQHITEELYAAKPETIIILSPHGLVIPEAFALNMSPTFLVEFDEFGDLATKQRVAGDIRLIHHYKELLESSMPVVLINQEKLDHGCGVPLYYFLQALKPPTVKVVPISPSLLDHEQHYRFGMRLQEDLINDTKRIAVIASADLSHRLTEGAPGGYSHWAKKFDETVVKHVRDGNHKAITGLDLDFVEEAGECGLRPIIMMLGMLNSTTYHPEVLSYEAPFGVGYLAASFTFHV